MKERARFTTAKPYPTFPLTPRADGRFCKRIRGMLHTFGSGGDWKAALEEYLRVASQLHAGKPRPAVAASASVTLRQLANRYLDARRLDVDAGLLHLRTWGEYRNIIIRFARWFGITASALELNTEAIDRYAAHLRKLETGHRLYNATRAHLFAWLRHCFAANWIPRFEFGVGFKRVPKGKMRSAKKNRLIAPAHLRVLLDAADPQMRAMILLGVNGGFGNTDCANLTRDVVDLAAGVIRFRRVKTGIERTVPLWPETVEALTTTMKARPLDNMVFRTAHGNLWVRSFLNEQGRTTNKDSLSAGFAKLMDGVAMAAERKTIRELYPGVGFYCLRHTFSTYANEVRDSDARRHIMGRRLLGLDDDYVESFFLPRLKVVTDHVRLRALGHSK